MKPKWFIWVIILFVLNTLFTWLAIHVSEFIVMLGRLDEFNGYLLTDEQEKFYLLMFAALMFIAQCMIFLVVITIMKRKQFTNIFIMYNLVVHFLLYIWYLYSAYQFTIIKS
ncbi:hypothetical protein [Ornithinibacillus scapharcae]|uniref:hypothetical protein n=1 Tax=Ornithinibacillus scapharcae TaxID=1147159 RepID=UPI000225AD55|nr:hypothetical protein [Ornithinibacillus scapharcae]